MKKVAALCEAHHVPIAPHCTMSFLGLTASLHVAASVAFFLIHEGYDYQLPEGVAHKDVDFRCEGYASLPEGPGLEWRSTRRRPLPWGRSANGSLGGRTIGCGMGRWRIIKKEPLSAKEVADKGSTTYSGN